ncbi:MAG: endolytic transglycosylase MltG [Armatimonadota bacterium]|nr:endolytic transglycosylase MltG [Armatimonadota bacterium]MDR7390212.1 endolytic transglycosylase MltG [Armatimonadota bacterium]MDR7394983.1 endolytic transglycosylase MltG [Armatimonadota bacterium]MDR7396887.1 endolytic transglycosylase MltG [Armatimonadota bacterium]MDR7398626.1 endolytic transglycosylase MltG [Armatimonadota bacterium]
MAVAAAGAAGLTATSGAPPGGSQSVVVVIPAGADAGRVADLLHRHGLVRSPLLFRLWARWRGLEGRIQAGEYRFSPAEGLHGILRRLAAGDVVRYRLVFPEGLTAEDVARRLEEHGVVSAEAFLAEVGRADRYWIPQMQGNTTGRLEGYLFPDTYEFPRGLPADRVVAAMVARFQEATAGLWSSPRPLGLSPYQVVTVASLVEREARRDAERPRIAGVLYNRLRRGMPLQVDATVLYALGEHKERVLYRDLEVDSPYNTYRRTGLPPGPIANPGLESLRAAMQPETHEYLYYVARPDGTHVFSRTLAEHERARRAVQR